MRTARIAIRRSIIPAAWCLVAACGHGPPEYYAQLASYYVSPNGKVSIALREFTVSRSAKGLSAFPDGGMPIAMDQGVEVNVCGLRDSIFRQVVVVHEAETGSFSTPLAKEWRDTTVRVSRFTGGDTVVRLPDGYRAGSGQAGENRRVLPTCAGALEVLKSSKRMPDGKPVTPPP